MCNRCCNYYSAPDSGGAEYCDERVCLSVNVCLCVCLYAIISPELHVQILCACYLWLWLRPPLATLYYGMYFRFYG